MSERDDPPRWIRAVYRRLFAGSRGDEILADLDRAFTTFRARHPRTAAWAWYLGQLLRPDTWKLTWALRRIRKSGAEARRRTGVSGLSLDLKLGWRMLWKSPGLTVVGVLGLAFGTAVGVGFFVVLSGIFYPVLPLEDGDRIVALENHDVQANDENRRSLHDFITWRERMRSVEQIAAASIGSRSLINGAEPSRPVRAAEVTAAAFQVARVQPLLGRYLLEDDERAGAPLVAVIGHGLWQSHFEGDPEVIGRTVFVGDVEHIVVGIMPPGFEFPRNQELWLPLRANLTRNERGEGPELYIFGRLARGATRELAQAELAALGARAAADFPETNERLRPRVVPYTHSLDDVKGVNVWEAAQMQAMVNLLLIAIAVNMSVLVYARTATRQAEIAVRTALGASRRRIVTQLFVEALLLSGVAAAIGLAAAHYVLGYVQLLDAATGEYAFWVDWGVQPRSAAFAVGLAILSAAIVGVVPGLKSTGRRLDADLRRLGGGSSVRLGWAWTALIVAQVAVAVAVLPTALTMGLREMRWIAVRSTFPAHEFLTARLALAVPIRQGMDAESYRREVAGRFADRLLALEQRLEAEPAVAGVTIEGVLPGRSHMTLVEEMPGRPRLGVRAVGIGTDYFAVVGARMLAGRDFRPSDAAASGDGLIVNEAFVQRVLGGGPALGRRLGFMPETESWRREQVVPPPWLEVVGVVQDLTSSVLDSEWSVPVAYYAVAPGSLQSADVHVHVRGGDVNGFAPRFREITAALDPDLRIGYVANLGTLLSPRLLAIGVAVILVVLGTVLLLSAAGIHALMSLTVTRRRREIGIRTALGADSSRLLANIFARAAWQLGLGGLVGSLLGAGLLLGSGAAWREASISLGGVVMLLLTAGLAAAVGPARRGLRIRPMEALKEE